MSDPGHVLFTRASAGGSLALHLDLATGVVTSRKVKDARTVSAETLEAMRSLASLVLRGPPADQDIDLTFACEEALEVQLGGAHTKLELWNGELHNGPEGALIDLLRAAFRGP
jgi:hypothetical protein